MKKQLSVWLALIFLISLCGCGKQDTQHLDMANYGDEFREKNDNLFANTSCEHLVVYRDWKEVLNDLIKSEITSDAYYGSGRFPVAGTYQDNAYFSEYDIVVSLSDYHKLYASESITDAEHHFQRIGEIYPKPCE